MKPETKLTKAMHLISETAGALNAASFNGDLKKLYIADGQLIRAHGYLSLVKKSLKETK